ncbi:zinc finger protein 653 [Ambystoma mexicanum]|uniref:zinc finger protein 653 n=1 Tax=Ambystoma mexicanum TaxID=8296 RepID=UPI0037E80AF2
MAEAGSEPSGGEEEEGSGGRYRKRRGRPRLTDSDRAQRRLESRKKYDVRRVYLGEAHGAWMQRRALSGWSDSRFAAYLLSLDQREQGKPWKQDPKKSKGNKKRRRDVNCMKDLVFWYEDHQSRCPYEPLLSELDPLFGHYTTAVWQCEAGHRYFQHLCSPMKPLNDSNSESEKIVNGVEVGHSDFSDNSWETNEQQLQPVTDDQASSQKTLSRQEVAPQDGVPQPFEQHHIETLSAEHGLEDCQDSCTASEQESMNAVVCIPGPEQDSPCQGTLFDGVHQETLGQVVSGCSMQDMVQNPQVIIIAGHSYEALTAENLHLNVGSSGGEEVQCTMMEGVAAYTQTEPLCSEPTEEMQPTDCLECLQAKTAHEALYAITKESDDDVDMVGKTGLELELEPALENGQQNLESHTVPLAMETTDTCPIVYEIPKEPEKRRSKRGHPAEGDGVLEMFHCHYEGCSQVYVALSSFQNHVNLVHRKGRTKICPHPGCGKKFYLSNHLGRHMIIHSGVREFICETCGKSFKRKNHLDVHRRTHTGETPLQCEICGYQFRQRASLNWHMKKHTSDVQYNFTCEHCGRLFEKLDGVKFHKLKSHPEVKVT